MCIHMYFHIYQSHVLNGFYHFISRFPGQRGRYRDDGDDQTLEIPSVERFRMDAVAAGDYNILCLPFFFLHLTPSVL